MKDLRKNKEVLVLLMFLVTLFLSARTFAAEPVVIGVPQVISGPLAKYGNMVRWGVELASDEINTKGGVLNGRPIKLLIEDTAGKKDQVINIFKKMIARDKVVAILGPTLSNSMFAGGPVANSRKIPTIGTSTVAKGIGDIGPYIFRTAMPESSIIPVTLKRAHAKYKFKNVGIMYANDDAFTKAGFEVFKDTLDKMNIKIASIESFASNDTDFSAQLTKLKSLKVDAIVVSSFAEAGASIVLQARQLGMDNSDIPIIGGDGFNSPKLVEIAGKSAEGAMVGAAWFIEKPDAVNQNFVKSFRKRFNRDPDVFAASAYDSTFFLMDALNRAESTESNKLRDALAATDYNGVLGRFKFLPNGDPANAEGVVVLQVKDGAFTILE